MEISMRKKNKRNANKNLTQKNLMKKKGRREI